MYTYICYTYVCLYSYIELLTLCPKFINITHFGPVGSLGSLLESLKHGRTKGAFLTFGWEECNGK